MSKLRIRLITLGQMPAEFDKKVIKQIKSDVFELVGEIENYSLIRDSDGPSWEFSDDLLSNEITTDYTGDFLIALSNVPLEQNYYTRRLSDNRIIFTFHEIKEYFLFKNIPLENMIMRLLYGYSLIYRRSGNQIPEMIDLTNFTHDETRGCIFDMNGIKSDIVHSCVQPILCNDCIERLKRDRVSNDMIENVEKEIKGINKKLFYRISDFVKSNPVLAIVISSFAAIILGAIGSVIGSIIYSSLK